MFIPQNEQGVIVLFSTLAEKAGWEFVEISDLTFPDAKIRKNGEVWAVEFEFVASNFLNHGHDHRFCDMIICWQNDYLPCPLPIIALNDSEALHREYVKLDPKEKEIEYWKRLALRAENKVKTLQRMLDMEGKSGARSLLKDEKLAPQLAEVADRRRMESVIALCGFYETNGTISRDKVMAAGVMSRDQWESARQFLADAGVPINNGSMGVSSDMALSMAEEFARRSVAAEPGLV